MGTKTTLDSVSVPGDHHHLVAALLAATLSVKGPEQVNWVRAVSVRPFQEQGE